MYTGIRSIPSDLFFNISVCDAIYVFQNIRVRKQKVSVVQVCGWNRLSSEEEGRGCLVPTGTTLGQNIVANVELERILLRESAFSLMISGKKG
mgnify:CR=1 FL=1